MVEKIKLPEFIKARNHNFAFLREALKPLEAFLILPEPTSGSTPSWFGFPITVRPSAPLSRPALIALLEFHKIPEGNLERLKKASMNKKRGAVQKLTERSGNPKDLLYLDSQDPVLRTLADF